VTYRDLVGKTVTILFGNGVPQLTCKVLREGDDGDGEALTVEVTILDGLVTKALVPKSSIAYVRLTPR
jgi:hypothetical protein